MLHADELFFGFASEADDQWELITLPLDRLTHTHLIGKTGAGKTTLMVSLAAQLIAEGAGVAVIDPAGDISRRILIQLINIGFFARNPDAFERFIYLDVVRAAREQQYLAFNILAGDYDPHTAASIVIEAYHRVWPTMQDGSSVNIELMTSLAAVVLAYNKLPLLPYLEDFYRVPAFRKRLLAQVQDTRVANWLETLEVKQDSPKIPAVVDTTLKRMILLSLPPVVGYALSQPENLLDGKQLLASNRSVCLNLNLEDDSAARLMGALFTRQMETAIKTRGQAGSDTERKPYLLILDEVHNFIAHSGQAVDRMFAEARRAGVFVMAAHQYWGQLREGTSGGFSQCGIIAIFQQKKESGRLSVEHIGLPIVQNKTVILPTPQGPRVQSVSPSDQVEDYVEIIDKLPVGSAYLRLPDNKLYLLQTLTTDDTVDKEELAAIEDVYIHRYFKPLGEINRAIDQVRISAPQRPTSQLPTPDATLHPFPPPATPSIPQGVRKAQRPVRQLPPAAPPRPAPAPDASEEHPPQSTKSGLKGGGKDAGF